jgi:thiol:disulfide interchange protein DsbD
VIGCALCCALPGLATFGLGAGAVAALWSVAPSTPGTPDAHGGAQDARSAKSPRSVATPQGIVDLIAASVGPSPQISWVGLRFRLADGWHIYWRNPGDSGGPPTVTWDAPRDVALGELRWPTPRRILLSHLVNYGYTGTVVLPMRLRTHAGSPRTPIAITANVGWLVCRDVCVPGKATLRLEWPPSVEERASVTEWRTLIEAAIASVPRPAPGAWQAEVESEPRRFVLRVRPDPPADAATFFPLDPAQIDDAAPQQVQSTGGALRIVLRKSPQLVQQPAVLRGVLALPDRPAVSIAAPVRR